MALMHSEPEPFIIFYSGVKCDICNVLMDNCREV